MAYHSLALVHALSLLGQLGPAAGKPTPPAADKAAASSKPGATPPAAVKAGSKTPPVVAAPAKPGAPAPAPAAPAKPRPRVVVAPPPARPTEAASASKSETDALRAEVTALRAELAQVVGAAPAKEKEKEAPDPNLAERERLEAQLAEEKNKLAAILKAVEGGLERAAVADSIERAEARIKELEAAIAKLAPPARPAPPPDEPKPLSLYDATQAIKRIETRLAAPATPTATATAAEPGAAAEPGTPTAPATTPAKPSDDANEITKALGLLPLEFTAFGDFFYQWSRPAEDGFYIGAIELDASLKLSPWVNVATAIAFNGADDEFGLGAFVIDGGVFGQGEGYPIQSKIVEKSGVSFGKFDVPFGAAYLEYPAVSNRLVTLPQSVMATHGGWNDIGAQAYALAEHWTGTAYIVNGPAYPTQSGEEHAARSATGGRLSAKLAGAEMGGSAAWVFGPGGAAELFAGGDLSAILGPLDVRAEYLLKRVDTEGPDDTHGVYGRAILKLDPAFLVGRYETILADSTILDRRFTAGGGVEVFPQGEVRAVYEQSIDSDARMVLLQLVGGSTFQPTGLRR